VLVAYPKISETFILNEILGLEEAGFELSIFSVWPSNDPRYHPGLARVDANTTYLFEAMDLIENVKDLRKLGKSSYGAGVDVAVDAAERLFDDEAGARLAQALRLATVCLEEELDHLHAHLMLVSAQVTYLAHLITGIPFTVTAHAVDIFVERTNAEQFRVIADAAKSLVTVCDANRDYIANRYFEGDRARVVRIYNGLPLDEISPAADPAVDPRLIFGAGRLVEKKGWDVLLEACSILKNRGTDFRCVIGGAGPEKERLNEIRNRLGLHDQVTFPGPLRREEVFEWMSRARVFTSPCLIAANGDQDALPTVLLEALALGVPVVSTRLGGIPEIVDDGVQGLLVPPRDPVELASALELLLANDQLWTAFSESGPKKIASTFDRRDTLSQLVEVFNAPTVDDRRRAEGLQ
jgi:glycosyltransferase involved in cell wall biosynthesis